MRSGSGPIKELESRRTCTLRPRRNCFDLESLIAYVRTVARIPAQDRQFHRVALLQALVAESDGGDAVDLVGGTASRTTNPTAQPRRAMSNGNSAARLEVPAPAMRPEQAKGNAVPGHSPSCDGLGQSFVRAFLGNES